MIRFFFVSIFLYFLLFTTGAQQVDSVNQIVNGSKHGFWIITGEMIEDKNYVPIAKVEEGRFNYGRRIGVWKKYYPSGKIKSEIKYINGIPKGDFITYFENGQIEEKGSWNAKVYNGKFTRYYENGEIAQQKSFNVKGKTEGEVIYYYPNGKAELVFETANGLGRGKATRYWPNGDIKEKITFNEKGESTTTGTLPRVNPAVKNARAIIEKKESVMAQGELNIGPLPSAKGKFLNDGYHKTYNENKDILMDGEFQEGKLWTGKHYIYDENGLLERIDVYKEGKFEGNGVL